MVTFANCVSSLSVGKSKVLPTAEAIRGILRSQSGVCGLVGKTPQYVGTSCGSIARKELAMANKTIVHTLEGGGDPRKALQALEPSHIIANYCPNVVK